MNRQARLVVVLSALVFGIAALAVGQQRQGRISGRVTDPEDIIVYQADVQVINLDTKATTPQRTDTTGSFWVEPLTAGHYQVTVRAQGFEPYSSPAITLATGQELVHDIQLKRAEKKD